jgi:hypothetical protein
MVTRQWFGVYIGRVSKTRTTDNWVILQVPQVMGTAETAWAAPLGYMTSAPTTGNQVQVMFIGGDINHPVYHLYAQPVDTTLTDLTSQVGSVPTFANTGTDSGNTSYDSGNTSYTIGTAPSEGNYNDLQASYSNTVSAVNALVGSYGNTVAAFNALVTKYNATLTELNAMRAALVAAGIL